MDSLLDNAPCGYISFNDEGIVLVVNATLCRQLGYSLAELPGTRFEGLLTVAGRIFFHTHFFPMLKLHQQAEEIFLSLVAKNGEIVPVVINAMRDAQQANASNICVCMAVHNRRKYEDEILEAKKQAEAALAQNKDLITAREEAEMQARELDNKVGRLGQVTDELFQFNHIINHDMQECIRKIITFSKLAKTERDETYLAKIEETAKRLKLINSSLEFFISMGMHQDQFGPVSLDTCLQDAIAAILKATQFDGLSVTNDLLPQIIGSARQLQMLFYQLLDNSIRFRRGNSVNVHVTSVLFESNAYRHITNRYTYTEMVKVTFTDNGSGFDNAQKEYVFNMLKKISSGSAGTGIGLAVCKKIADNHNGEISLSSELNKGTIITLVLPVHQP